ncbi:hypothetical protein BJ165DRAFT_1559065 [Panaeolus papilionaceus]|nr:hypothetical protein BJ165DRAFT_1559065 [Panaeolus papilionaceus]
MYAQANVQYYPSYSYYHPYPCVHPHLQSHQHHHESPTNPSPSPALLQAPQAPLGSITNFIISTPNSIATRQATQSTSTSKRKDPPQPTETVTPSTSKRRRLAQPTTLSSNHPSETSPAYQPPAAYGIGPQITHGSSHNVPSTPAAPLPQQQQQPGFSYRDNVDNLSALHRSLLKAPKTNNTVATDVWYFTCGLKSEARPLLCPANEKCSVERPSMSEFLHLGCKLCKYEQAWTVWKNGAGQTANIRHHLQTKHAKLWRELVVLNELKGWKDLSMVKVSDASTASRVREPFTLCRFHDQLVKWITADDQVMTLAGTQA